MEHVYKSGSISVPGGGVGDMSGYSALKWNGRDDDGALVANGVYFYKITTDNNSYWGKVMVLD
jgi:flagellar hook assembly protein FlgD